MFAILFEGHLIEQKKEEIPQSAGWEGGVNGHNDCAPNFCEQTDVSYNLWLVHVQMHPETTSVWDTPCNNRNTTETTTERHPAPKPLRDGETTIKIKCAFSWGDWGQRAGKSHPSTNTSVG